MFFAHFIMDLAPVCSGYHSDSFVITGCPWRSSAWQPPQAASDDRVITVTTLPIQSRCAMTLIVSPLTAFNGMIHSTRLFNSLLAAVMAGNLEPAAKRLGLCSSLSGSSWCISHLLREHSLHMGNFGWFKVLPKWEEAGRPKMGDKLFAFGFLFNCPYLKFGVVLAYTRGCANWKQLVVMY